MDGISGRFAELLRSSRQRLKLSQDELADRVSLSRASITNYESGQQSISLEHAVTLASELNFSLDILKGTISDRIELELRDVDPKVKDVILKTLKE